MNKHEIDISSIKNHRYHSSQNVRSLRFSVRFIAYTLFAGFGLISPITLLADDEAQINLDDAPPSISKIDNPNVMLILDNSESMNNIDQYQIKSSKTGAKEAYDPTVTYDDWSYADNDAGVLTSGLRWTPSATNIALSTINNISETCSNKKPTDYTSPYSVPTYAVEGTNSDGTTTKCLILSDPAASGTTYYEGNYLNYLFTTFSDGNDLANPAVLATFSYVPKKSRLQVQRDVAKTIVDNNSNIRFGLATFNFSTATFTSGLTLGGHGAKILNPCDTYTIGTDEHIDKLKTNIDTRITADGGATPLAESLYEITRYFRGYDSAYNSQPAGTTDDPLNNKLYNDGTKTYVTPIQTECQKNFAIMLTDGLPTQDSNFRYAGADLTVISNPDDNLPNYDGLNEVGAYADGTVTLQLNDDNKYDTEASRIADENDIRTVEGTTLFLDDLAKFAYDTDMQADLGATPFVSQNLRTLVVGFTKDNQMLKDAAHYGSGRSDQDPQVTDNSAGNHYFTADNEIELKNALQRAVTSASTQTSSATSVTSNASFASALSNQDIYLFQATFSSKPATTTVAEDWFGNLHAFKLTNTATGSIDNTAAKSAAQVLDESTSSRNIATYNPDTKTGMVFKWDNFSAAQQTTYFSDREEILNFIRGDHSCETNGTGSCTGTKDLRDRTSRLGSIINSGPIYIGPPSERYFGRKGWPKVTPIGEAPERRAEDYNFFKKTHKNREPIIYVGANDGMLHAFSAKPKSSDDPPSLEEKFTYIPNAVLDNNLKELALNTYTHKYYVDGTPTIIDVLFDNGEAKNDWHTVLVGGLGKGGKAIYALDVTDPAAFDETNFQAKSVLWEFTHPELFYSFGRPAIVRMHNNKWVAVFGSGYTNDEEDEEDDHHDHDDEEDKDPTEDIYKDKCGNRHSKNDDDEATLFFVDVETGTLLRKITVEDDETTREKILEDLAEQAGDAEEDKFEDNNRQYRNGISTPAPVDIDGDYIVDYVYVGDLRGNLWRFNVKDSSACNWTISGPGTNDTSKPIFTAEYFDKEGTDKRLYYRQPITSRPEVSKAGANLMINFGTGMFLGSLDKQNKNVQSFYGILDNVDNSTPNPVTRLSAASDFLPQSIVAEGDIDFYDAENNKETQTVREFSKVATTPNISWYIDFNNKGNNGERSVNAPIVRGSGASKRVIFNTIIPEDTACGFGGTSWLMELNANNGNKTTEPVFDLNYDGKINLLDNASTTVYNGWSQTGLKARPTIISSDGKEFKYMSGSGGTITPITEALPEKNTGRQSWRQIK